MSEYPSQEYPSQSRAGDNDAGVHALLFTNKDEAKARARETRQSAKRRALRCEVRVVERAVKVATLSVPVWAVTLKWA